MLLIGGLIFLLIIMFAPFNLTIAERRAFRVVDQKGIPVREAMVAQTWNQFSLHYMNKEICKVDANGYMLLPTRTLTARLFDLVSGAIGNILEYTINAGIGSYDYVVVYADGYEVTSFTNGKGLESGIVVLKKK